MTIYCRPAFPMSTLSTLIVSALVRYHLLRDIMSDNGSVFLIPGSLRRKMAAVYGSSNIPLYGEIKAS